MPNEEPRPSQPAGPTTRFHAAAEAILRRTVRKAPSTTEAMPTVSDTPTVPSDSPTGDVHNVPLSSTETLEPEHPSITPRPDDIELSQTALKDGAEHILYRTREGRQIQTHRETNAMVIKFLAADKPEPPKTQEDSDRVQKALVGVYKFDPTDPERDVQATYARASRAQSKLVELTNQLANENPYGIGIDYSFDSGAPPLNGVDQKITVTGINLRGELDLAVPDPKTNSLKPLPPQSFRQVTKAIDYGMRAGGNPPR